MNMDVIGQFPGAMNELVACRISPSPGATLTTLSSFEDSGTKGKKFQTLWHIYEGFHLLQSS
mgnify:CR=1 FL=1